jgi:tetrahydromethanopterin S-methyltransferase subunit C
MPMLQRRSKPVKGRVPDFLASVLGVAVVLVGEVSLDVGLVSVVVGVVSFDGLVSLEGVVVGVVAGVVVGVVVGVFGVCV